MGRRNAGSATASATAETRACRSRTIAASRGDGYLSIAALNRALREKLCQVLELEDPHTGVDLGNLSDDVYFAQKALMARIEERLVQQPSAHWVARFEAAGIPCSPINYPAHLYDDPQANALEMIWKLGNRELGGYKAPGHPVRFSKTGVKPSVGAPTLGEHSTALLEEFGYSAEAIAGLREAGVVK